MKIKIQVERILYSGKQNRRNKNKELTDSTDIQKESQISHNQENHYDDINSSIVNDKGVSRIEVVSLIL